MHADRRSAEWPAGPGEAFERAIACEGRRLAPRLKAEAASREQPVPTVNLP